MRILSITPRTDPGGGRFHTLAMFDVEIEGAIRLYNLRLLRAPDGRHLIYAPNAHGKRCATFLPELAHQITAAAIAALGGRTAHDQRAA